MQEPAVCREQLVLPLLVAQLGRLRHPTQSLTNMLLPELHCPLRLSFETRVNDGWRGYQNVPACASRRAQLRKIDLQNSYFNRVGTP